MRDAFRCCALITLTAASVVACTPSSSNAASLCEQTVRDYAVFRDDPAKAESYGALFTEDGSFTLAGNTVTGQDALIARHRASNAAAVWRHNMIDIDIEKTGDTVTGRTRFVVYTGPRGDSPGPATREIIGYYDDIFEVEAGRCLIRGRRVSVEFDTSR